MRTSWLALLAVSLTLAGCSGPKKKPGAATGGDEPAKPTTPAGKPEPTRPARPPKEDECSAEKIQKAIQDLEGKNADARARAAADLAACKSRAKAAAPALARALQDANEPVRYAVVQALVALGPDAEEAVPALGEALKNDKKSERVRREALQALNNVGPAALPALDAVVGALGDPDKYIPPQAIRTLAKVDPQGTQTLAVYIDKGLPHPDPAVGRAAADALVGLGEPAVQPLINAVKEKEARAANLAAQALARLKDKLKGHTKAAVEVFVQTLQLPSNRNEDKLRAQLAQTLGEIGPEAQLAVPALIDALQDGALSVRTESAKALVKIGGGDKQVPALLRVLRQKEGNGHKQAADVLAAVGEPAVDGLTEALGDLQTDVQIEAASALERIGPKAQKAVQRLERLLKQDEPDVKKAAGKALKAIDPETAAKYDIK